MQVFLSEPRGFCNGVQNALNLLDEALAKKLKLSVLNEIVHNKTIIKNYQDKGVVFVKDLKAVPNGGHIVFSAHGVAPDIRRQAAERNLQIIDATCPLVKKVHREALGFTKHGVYIIYIGHHKHEEAAGVYGEAPQNITIIENSADIPLIPRDKKQYAALTQTTLNITETAGLIAQIKKIFPGLIEPAQKDICYATAARQEAARNIAAKTEAVVIIGSRNSSNSARLKEVVEAQGRPAYLVDNYRELPAEIKQYSKVGLTAGASAPEYLVRECLAFLQNAML
ncbi:MAG: 4-hydroxy-3-methylbut-2-enyl diphosphate reductase [Candidatus Margulisbacteria bacterium]|jgi:4-hydroxy-3-methylbut-2-enyl diphosphate reductase|nr:4-hydroxy-3-methylbut-2-enyl diphosphate reductase [Candidatus Margulisiibacteriota bacterium]